MQRAFQIHFILYHNAAVPDQTTLLLWVVNFKVIDFRDENEIHWEDHRELKKQKMSML